MRNRRRGTMRRGAALALGLALGVAGGAAVLAAATPGRLAAPPALLDPNVPRQPEDLGIGERLYVVVGGFFPTREAAEAANETLAFGDVQGYYAIPVGQFLGLGPAPPEAGGWLLGSAFRTREGAGEFQRFARQAGATAEVQGPFLSLGGEFAGLGQERRPDGLGPLTRPVSDGG